MGSPLVFVPVDPSAEQLEASTWDVSERHEFAGAADEAIIEYSRLARSADDGRINAGPDGRLAFSVLKNSIEIWAEPISSLVAGREP